MPSDGGIPSSISVKDIMESLKALQAERAVLASAVVSGDAAAVAVEKLTPEHFQVDVNRRIFEAIRALYNDGKPIDAVTIGTYIEDRGGIYDVNYLLEMLEEAWVAINIDAYCRTLHDRFVRRRLLFACVGILGDITAVDTSIEEIASEATTRLLTACDAADNDSRPFTATVRNALEQLTAARSSPSMLMGLPTGFSDLDRILGGLRKGEMIVVAGRPSMGKTTFGLNMVRRLSVEGDYRGLVFSLEMSAEQLVFNLLAACGKVDGQKMRQGYLSQSEYDALIDDVASKVYEAPVMIEDPPAMTIGRLTARARRLARSFKPDYIMIDYLQLMHGTGDSREQDVAAMSRGVKALAKSLDIPVITLAQLNRKTEERSGNEPRLADLRESGAIEQDADVVMLLHRWDYYREDDRPHQIQVHVAKNRNGPTGKAVLSYARHFMRMENLYGASA